MSRFIQIPNRITELKKFEILTYTYIRSQIKDNTRQASYAQADLARKIGRSEDSVTKYIADLRKGSYFDSVYRKHGAKSSHAHNVYVLPELGKDYFIVLPALLDDDALSAEQKEILLRAKAHCEKGTNHFSYGSQTGDLTKKLGIGKNRIKSELKKIEAAGYIRFISNTLILTNSYFPLYLENTLTNEIYEVIYNYCIANDKVPPTRNNKALGIIAAHYSDYPNQIKTDLSDKCKNLPKDIDINYFCKALTNMTPDRITKRKYIM
jgi:hypothetical protein